MPGAKGWHCLDCGGYFEKPGSDPHYPDDPACPACESIYIVDLDDDPGWSMADRRIKPWLRCDIGRRT